MNSNEYQELAARTLIDAPEQPLTGEEILMLRTLLRFHSRLGVLTEKYKKAILHRHHKITWSDLSADLGDLQLSIQGLSEVALRGVIPGDSVDDDNTMVLWNVIGLLGESSEFAGLILDHALHPLPVINQDEFSKELGDVNWYLAAIATKLGLQLGTIQEANIDKLKKRFPDGFTTADSVARVDVTP